MDWFACVPEIQAFSITEKMDTASLFELMADCRIIVQCNSFIHSFISHSIDLIQMWN